MSEKRIVIATTRKQKEVKDTHYKKEKIEECKELVAEFKSQKEIIATDKRRLIEQGKTFLKEKKKSSIEREFLYVLLRAWVKDAY